MSDLEDNLNLRGIQNTLRPFAVKKLKPPVICTNPSKTTLNLSYTREFDIYRSRNRLAAIGYRFFQSNQG
jgi:hypothetical protein